MPLPPRLRWRLDQIRKKTSGGFFGEKESPRPKLCPACGTLVGATASRCHQCGASLTFSLAAASKSLERFMPTASPVTYSILSICCVLYVVSLMLTIREGGFPAPGGGLGAVFGFAAIRGDVLERLGNSLPLGLIWYLKQPWRYVTAIFLHGSLLHIIFDMWVLMDIGPEIEETYGSARYLFIYVITGVGGYIVSSYFGQVSVGASGALLGLIGLLLATTLGSRSASMQMLRGRLIRWLIYLAVWGLLVREIDNYAHAGGLATGLLLGKVMTDRPPATPEARKLAQVLGWMTALVVATSFVMMALWLRRVS